jgi:hypothetical protein
VTQDEQRQLVVAEARTWLGTRYRNRMAIKGKGVDCAQILLESFRGAGLPVHYEPERYSSDWHLHRSEERYLSVVTRYAPGDIGDQRPIRDRGEGFAPPPADILMWKVGRTFSHSALVSEWPRVIHASLPDAVALEVDVRGTVLLRLPMIHCSYWGVP